MSWHAIHIKDKLRHKLAPIKSQDPKRKPNTGMSECSVLVKSSSYLDDTEACSTCETIRSNR